MAENEADGQGQEESGVLSQAELDALLAAADSEPTGPGADTQTWEEKPAREEDLGESPLPESTPSVVDLPSFGPPPTGTRDSSPVSSGMNRVRDIPLEVTVELGRTRLLIKDLLELGAGSIIELDKLAGEPVDLFANGLLVARGEVIVIDDNFGVRVTEVITAAERRQMQNTEADALAA